MLAKDGAVARQAPASSWSHAAGLVLVALLLAGLARGLFAGHAALRGDEAFSVRLVQMPLATLFEAMAVSEPNPPLQFLFLQGWLRLVGTSEVALRWPSVLAGVLTVALTYRLGATWLGRPAAVFACAWVAVQPFLVWYGQDLRVYASLTLWVLVTAWCLWQALEVPPGRASLGWWAAVAVGAWVCMMLHYFAALAIGALALAALADPRLRSRWRLAAATLAVSAIAYLPWAVYSWPLLSAHTKSWLGPLSAGEVLWRTLVAYSSGGRWAGAPDVVTAPAALALGALAVIGLIAVWRRHPLAAVWMLALGPGMPVALGVLNVWRPSFTAHYVISGVVGVLLLATAGVFAVAAEGGRRVPGASWARWAVAGVVAAAIGLISAVALINVHTDPAYAKSPDWRTLSAYLKARAEEGRIVLMNLPDPALELYLGSSLPLVNAPPEPIPADADPASPGGQAAFEQLATIESHYERVYFLYNPNPLWDPAGVSAAGLAACCELIDDVHVAGFRLQTYDTPLGAMRARQALSAVFEHGLTLTGYRLEPTAQGLHVTLFWQAQAPVPGDYTVYVHLTAPDGFVLATGDGDPQFGRAPTSTWSPGRDIIDPHPIVLPADLAPGTYFVEIGWYDRATGARLSLVSTSGNGIRLPQPYTVT